MISLVSSLPGRQQASQSSKDQGIQASAQMRKSAAEQMNMPAILQAIHALEIFQPITPDLVSLKASCFPYAACAVVSQKVLQSSPPLLSDMSEQNLESPAERYDSMNYPDGPGGISELDYHQIYNAIGNNDSIHDPSVNWNDSACLAPDGVSRIHFLVISYKSHVFNNDQAHRDLFTSFLCENEPTQPQTRQSIPDTMSQTMANDTGTTRKLQCPFRVAEGALGRRLFSCRGVEAKSMAHVRRHLTRPVKGRSHLPFVKLCPTCNDDFLDKDEFEMSHGDQGLLCDNPRKQRKGAIAQQMQWDALYIKVEALVSTQAGAQGTYNHLVSACNALLTQL
jgi:hypothetical protein